MDATESIDMAGSDGIGNAPFAIGPNNVDHYPLMSPSRAHDVVILDATTYPAEAYVGWTRIGDSRYCLNKDLNRDNIINVVGISIAALSFGESIVP